MARASFSHEPADGVNLWPAAGPCAAPREGWFFRLGIAAPDRRVDDCPHRFSGGMRRRVMIAMALVLDPPLVIADEPATALDDRRSDADPVDPRRDAARARAAIILTTHDLGLLARVADRVMAMYAGRRMEPGTIRALFGRPAHPYTAGLLRSVPGNHRPGGQIVPVGGPSSEPPRSAAGLRLRTALPGGDEPVREGAASSDP